MKIFSAPRFDTSESKFKEYRVELANRIKQLFEHVKTENVGTSQRQCERFAKDLYSRHVESKLDVKGSYKSFDQLLEDWTQVRRTYLQKTAGPAQMEILSNWLFPRMTESVQRVWNDMQSGMDEKHTTLQRKLAETESRSTAARDNLDQEHSRQKDMLEVAKRQWLSEKMELERGMEDAKRAMEEQAMRASREKAQLVDSERTLREQCKILQERLQSHATESRMNARLDAASNATAELGSLKDAVVAMMSELKGIDMEKKQLEMKAEHEKQLIALERKFQRQLMDARRKNEGLIDSMRQTYEDEVDGLKTHRTELASRIKDLERELEQVRGEGEVLKHRLAAAEKEQALQQHVIATSQRQSELITAFLERCPGRGGPELQPVREELSALAGGANVRGGGYGGGASGGNGGSSQRSPGPGGGGMPWAAANASVFRSVPGV